MSEQHQYNLDYFYKLTGGDKPSLLSELTHQQVEDVRHLVDRIITRETNGHDKFYESMAMMMKYVPNFILHSIAPKYIEPAIAAKITSNLSLKQILGVTAGMPVEYVGDAAVNMDSSLSAAVLAGLKKKMATQVIEYLVSTHPLAMLDILAHSPSTVRTQASKLFNHNQLMSLGLSPIRQKTFDEVRHEH